MSGVLINVEAKTDKATRDLAQVNESLKAIKGSTAKVTEGLSSMAKGFAAFAVTGGAAAYIVKIADEFQNLSNQIKLVTDDTKEFTKVQSKLVDLSIKNRIEISATAKIYSTLSKNVKNAAGSSDLILKATESIQKAVSLSGSSAESATAAIIQLGQGLSAGTLRGEELNSVMEQTPRLAKAIADGMGLTLGQMRALAAEGKVTADAVFGAILSQTEKLNIEFGKMKPTLAQATVGLGIAMKSFINDFETGLGVTSSIAVTMDNIATSIQDASISAKGLGNELGYTLSSVAHKASQISAPIISLVSSVFTHIVKALPRVDFTRTIFGDFMSGMRTIDDMTGGTFTRISHILRFGIYDLITYDSAAESALKKLKRLSPTNWLTGGLNVQTLNDFFDTKMLYRYGEAFNDLSTAISGNSDSLFVKIGEKFRRMTYTFRDLARYVGILPDTFLTFRIGDIDAFNYTMTELLRGVTGVQLKFTQINKLTKELFNTSTTRLELALEDIAMAIPSAIVDAIKMMIDAVLILLPRLKQAISDFIGGPIFEIPSLKIKVPRIDILGGFKMPTLGKSNKIVDFVDASVESLSSLGEKTSVVFSSFKKSAVSAYDAVIGKLVDVKDKIRSTLKDFFTSSTPLEHAASYMNSFTGLLAPIVGAFGVYAAILVNIAAAVDLAFSPTLLRRFRDVLLDALTALSRFAPKLADAIASFLGLKDVLYTTTAIAGAWLLLGNAAAAAMTFVDLGISKLIDSTGKLFRVSLFDKFYDKFIGGLGRSIDGLADILNSVYEKIKIFGKKVIRVFFEIWDEVIGHSWWPDTIDGVVAYSETLTQRITPAFERFKKYVTNAFESIAEGADNFSIKEFAINVRLKFISIKEALKDVLAEISNEFPTLLKGLAFAVAGIAAYIFLPMNAAVAILLSDLALTAVSQLSIFAEALGERVFGASLAENLGTTIGSTAAAYLIEIVKAIPGVTNLILTAAYGFGKSFITGLLGALPLGLGNVLGGISESLFKIVDITGLGGPLGILSLFFFGKGAMAFFKSIGFFTKSIEGVEKFFAGMASKFVGPQQGLVGRVLFGIGPAPILAGLGLILGVTGGFDSLFGGSLLAKYGTLGLLGYAMFGGNPVKLVATAWSNVIVPIFSMFSSAATSGNSAMGSLLGSILASRKAMLGLLAAYLYFRSSSASASEMAGGSISDSSTMLDRLKQSLVEMKDTLFEAATANPSAAIYGALSVGIGAVLAGKFAHNLLIMKRSAMDTATAIVKTTRLDKAFSLGSTAVNAVLSIFPAIQSGISGLITAVMPKWQALMAWMAFQWRDMVWMIKAVWTYMATQSFAAPFLSNLANMYAGFQIWSGKIKAQITALIVRFKTLSTAMAIGTLAAGGTAFAGGDLWNVIDAALIATTAFQVLGTIAPKAQAAIVALFGRLATAFGAILSFSAVITAGVSLVVGGILGVMFFGEGDTFFEKLDDVWHRMKRILGISNEVRQNTFENKKRANMLSEADNGVTKRFGLDAAPSLAGVNFDLLNDREKKALDGSIEKYKKALEDASDEYTATGAISEELRNSINKLTAGTQEIADRLAVKSARNLPESIKNLEKDAQSQDTGWWTKLKTGIEQAGLDIGYTIVEKIRQARRVISDQETKALITRDLNKQRAEKDTWWKAGWADLSGPDKSLQESMLKLKRPDNISMPSLGKEFNDSFQNYRTKLFDMRDKANSNGGFTKTQIAEAADALHYAREELKVFTEQVKALEEREDSVTRFNKKLRKVEATLKDVGVDVDKNLLFSGDDQSFAEVKKLTNGIKALDDMLNKSDSEAGGLATFEERVAAQRRKMELITDLQLRLKQQDQVSSPQAAITRINSSVNMGLDPDAIQKIGDQAGAALRDQLQTIEEIKLKLAADSSLQDILAGLVFPENIDEEVAKRIKGSTTKLQLVSYLEELSRAVKDKAEKAFTVSDYLKALQEKSGVALSGQDLANDDPATTTARLSLADKISSAKNRLSTLKTNFDIETESLSKSPGFDSSNRVRMWLGLSTNVEKSIQAMQEQFELLRPTIETTNDKLERQMQLAGLTAAEMLRIPKGLRMTQDVLTSTGSIKVDVSDAKSLLQASDDIIQNADKRLKSKVPLSDAQTVKLKSDIEEWKAIAAATGEYIKLQFNSIPDQLARISAAGGSINLNAWFAIDSSVLTELDTASSKIIGLNRLLASKKLTPELFKELSKDLAINQQAQASKIAIANAQTAVGNFGIADSISRRNSANTVTGLAFDGATYAANKTAIDELTLQSLALSAWFEALPAESKAGLMGFMDVATQSIKRSAERLLASNPNASVGAASAISGIGISTDPSAMNRLTDADRERFKGIAIAIGDKATFANAADTSEIDRRAVQQFVDMKTYELSEAIRLATLKPQETTQYQAGQQFATSVTNAFSTGMKDILSGAKKPKEVFTEIANTFASSVVDTLIAGIMDPFTGENGIITKTLRELGSSIFGLGAKPQDTFSLAVDKFTAAVGMMSGGVASDNAAPETSNWFTKLFKNDSADTLDEIKKDTSVFQGYLGMATGGAVFGAGTGTSDSIPAMLSNGEFVVNAKAAAKFKPLLEQINAGKHGAFSEGGFAVADTFGPTASFGAGVMDYNFTGLTTGFSTLASDIGDFSANVEGLSGATMKFADTSSFAIENGFKGVSKGMGDMGQYIQKGFVALGMASLLAAKPGKFNWTGAILSIASSAMGVYGASSTVRSPSQYATSLDVNSAGMGGFATGGFISGPGTGTSDSIAAMLSNGEYVINAASTSKFKPLLDQINSGTFPKFSTGGVVGELASAQNLDMTGGSQRIDSKSSTTINLNITGDVSRQTRNEIARMLPSIASGVNQHNYEIGYRA